MADSNEFAMGNLKLEGDKEDFENLFNKLKERNNENQQAVRLKTVSDALRLQGGNCVHTYSTSEELGYTNWINKHLGSDEDCLRRGDIPLKYEEHDLFKKLDDGLILCKMVNLAVPGTIVPEAISTTDQALSLIYNRLKNVAVGINSAKSIGCHVTNIGATDIQAGRPHLVLGIIWQLIKKTIIETITLANHNELATLLRPGEELADMRYLSPEKLLLRWINFQLERAKCNRTVDNFTTDLEDSVVYSHLLNQVAPANLKDKLLTADSIQKKADLSQRAVDVCSNAKVLDIGDIMQPGTIYGDNIKSDEKARLHLAFLADLFNRYPALDPVDEGVKEQMTEFVETLEEKTYRNWINSMGVGPTVHYLYTDLSDGLILLKLIDNINEGIVDWKKVNTSFSFASVYRKIENCENFVDCCRRSNMKMVTINGKGIHSMQKTQVLSVCFQLMEAYLLKNLSIACDGKYETREDRKIIHNWVNEQLKSIGDSRSISSFSEEQLRDSHIISLVLNSIRPNAIDTALLGSDHFHNAQLAIAAAWSHNAVVYALPEHIVSGHSKMIMTVFISLMILSQSKAAAAPSD